MSDSSDYEDFVASVIRETSGVDMHQRRIFRGRITGRRIQVDACFELTIAGGAKLLFVLECKLYKNRVSVSDVEEFHSKLDDIGAHKGIMITTVGYQAGAKRAAIGRGIALALLSPDSQPGEIKYIANSATLHPASRRKNKNALQGNIFGLISTTHEGGLRFEGFIQLLGMLVIDGLVNKIE